jgi:hypothetical protein
MLKITVFFALLSTMGCATIVAGGPDRIPVHSNPPGAAVILDGVQVGVTPMEVTLDRTRGGGNIRIEMAGFAPVTVQRTKSINGWFWASFCLGGVIGMLIDYSTGNMNKFDDTPIAVGLSPMPGGPMPGMAPGPMQGPPPPPPPSGPPPGY